MKTSALLLICGLAACRPFAPESQTSLSLDPGPNPGRSPRQLSMVWLHHSTGDNLLAGGLREALRDNNVAFHDINYDEAKLGDYVIGDHTDPPDFPKTFNTPRHFAVIRHWEIGDKQHDIVMFKSCFPSSNILDQRMLNDYRRYYEALLPTFKAHPGILFIAMSTPPLVKRKTSPANAARARRWARWITTSYAQQLPNVKVFDLFDALALREGAPDENTLVPQFAQGSTDSHPSPAGARAVTRMFIPWFNRTIRQAGLVQSQP